ncbi:MAG: FAD-dependent oxidoreductase, partial [Acidimicrobiales bacterium]
MPTTSISEPVVIAGGGPVGLTAGVRLGSLGVRVIVLEAEDEPKTDWRASTFHCATLEVLEPTGIVPDMLALGLQVPSYQLRDRSSGIVAEFEFSALGDETAYPYRLQLNQQKVVGLLLERLKSLENVDLRFGRRLSGLSEHGSGVVARVTRGNGGSSGQGSEEEIEASFLIGADGAASTVRRCLGVGFSGSTYPERFLIVSIEEDLSDRLDDLAYVNYVADPVEWLFILR